MKRLEHMTWPQIRELQQKVELLVVPLGATEQHGPALPIGTDSIIADALCAEACGRVGVPYTTAWNITCSIGHTAKWPGTLSLSPQTLISAIVEVGRWAAATGWRKLYFVNAHAGNHAALRVAVDLLRLELLGRLQVGCCDTFSLTPDIANLFQADARDLHANKAECDLLLYLAPETVDSARLAQADDPDRTGGLIFSYPVSQTSLNGTTGAPSLGNPQDGEKLFGLMADELARRLAIALHEVPPLPAREWAPPHGHFHL